MHSARPMRGRNAIEAVAFVLQYVRAFDLEESEKIAALKDSFVSEGWQVLPMQGMTVQVGAPGFMQQPTANGYQFQRPKADGTPAWMIRAFNNTIVVNCFDYSRWTDVWAQASRYLSTVAAAIASESLRINIAALQITDKFISDPVPDSYSLGDVFRAESPYLPANVASYGPIWYVNSGWAVNLTGSGSNGSSEPSMDGAVLGNAITLSSSALNKTLVATIDHIAQITFHKNKLPANLFSGNAERDDIFLTSSFCDVLKPNNKTIVRSLLSDAQLTAIGLTE
jgi:hypothetical protein